MFHPPTLEEQLNAAQQESRGSQRPGVNQSDKDVRLSANGMGKQSLLDELKNRTISTDGNERDGPVPGAPNSKSNDSLYGQNQSI